MIDYRYKGSVTNMSKVKEYYLEEEYTPIQAIEMLQKENQKLKNIIKEIKEYIEKNTNSNSYTTLTSGKTTDIAYCIVAFEDILEIIDKESE